MHGSELGSLVPFVVTESELWASTYMGGAAMAGCQSDRFGVVWGQLAVLALATLMMPALLFAVS